MWTTFLHNWAKVLTKKILHQNIDATYYTILEKNFPPGAPLTFVQVGANDGVSYDSLYDFVKKRDLKGLVIEPLADFYKKLVKNYRFAPGVTPVRKAVHPSLSEIELYRVDPRQMKKVPGWTSGIASVYPDYYQKFGTPRSVMIKEKVPASHLMTILDEHQFCRPTDLLQIDVEGYDYEVLKQIDFSRWRPGIIKYEYENLKPSDQKASWKLLKKAGYFRFFDEIDVIAVDLWRIKL